MFGGYEEEDESVLEFKVTDTGVGIKEEHTC